MNTLNNIFKEISIVNPTTVMGSEITSLDVKEAIERRLFLAKSIPATSVAFKVLTSTAPVLSDKQLWVVAYELFKNEEYATKLNKKVNVAQAIRNQEEEARKAKLSANKSATQPVLDFVKSNGLKLGDYYKFLKENKQFAKEYYSKKYTMTSAEAFINK